jgi:hypothetical protein
LATQLLVTAVLEDGRRLIQALDQRKFPVNAALWYLHEGGWRLIIASSLVDSDGPREAYRKINEVLQAENIHLNLSDIAVVESNDALVRLLRIAINTGIGNISETRFTANTINGVYIEDAYIYRVA